MALGLAMLHVIIHEQRYDAAFVTNHTIGFKRLSRHIEAFTPEWAAGITGISPKTIQHVARTYATTKPAAIMDGNGLDQHLNVVQTLRVVSMLAAITGNIDVPGGNVIAPKPKTAPYPALHSIAVLIVTSKN
jgi:anaerobic selenocysteine-containing dehydrogenase